MINPKKVKILRINLLLIMGLFSGLPQIVLGMVNLENFGTMEVDKECVEKKLGYIEFLRDKDKFYNKKADTKQVCLVEKKQSCSNVSNKFFIAIIFDKFYDIESFFEEYEMDLNKNCYYIFNINSEGAMGFMETLKVFCIYRKKEVRTILKLKKGCNFLDEFNDEALERDIINKLKKIE